MVRFLSSNELTYDDDDDLELEAAAAADKDLYTFVFPKYNDFSRRKERKNE